VLLDDHRVDVIAEVTDHGDGAAFHSLFERTAEGLTPTGRVDRGESRLVERLARTDGSYAAVRETVRERGERIGEAAGVGKTEPERYAEFVDSGGEAE
jgi:flagellar protein FlaI